jgi:hypothetical protein
VNAFAASSSATGEIFVAAGNYTENVNINGLGGNLANLSGLIGAGSDTTTINGYLDAYNFNNPFTLSGFSFFTNGVHIESSSDVFVDDVVVTESSGYGLLMIADGDISISDSAFSDNAFDGLHAYSYSGNITGNIMLDGVTASGNGEYGASVESDGDISIFDSAFNNNNYDGLFTRSYSGSVMLDGVTASGNGDRGAYLEADASMVEVFCSDFSDNDLGLQGGKSGPDLYLNGVTFSGNASGDYENPSGNVWVSEYDCGSSVNTPANEPAHDGGDKKEQTFTSLYTIIEQTQGQLPAALETGTFGSALKVVLTNEGKDVADLAMTLSFPIPADMKDASLVVMFWNGSSWVEVSGGNVVNGLFVITVNQPGDYVLVAK